MLVNLTVAQYRALGSSTMTASDTVTLLDTGANLASLTAAEVAVLAGKQIDIIDATDGVLSLTVAQYQGLGTVALTAADTVKLVDAGANLAAMTAANINALAGKQVDIIDASDNALRLTVAQYQSLIATTITLTATDTITLADTGANIASLTAAQLGVLAANGIDIIDATDNTLSLRVDQYLALAATACGLTTADVVTLADTGANLAALTAAQFSALAANGVDDIDASDNALSLTVAQYLALIPTACTLTAADVVTLADTGANIANLTAAQFGALAGNGVDVIDATNNVLTFSVAQYSAVSASSTKLAAGDVVTIVDTAGNLIANPGGYLTGSVALTITDTPTIAQLNAIDAVTTGVLTYGNIGDTAANLATNVGGYVTGSHSVYVTDSASIDQLRTIDLYTAGTVIYGTVADIASKLVLNAGGYVNGAHPVYVTTTATAAQLAVIRGYTTGVVSVFDQPLSPPLISSVGGADYTVSSLPGDNLVIGTATAGAAVTIKSGLTLFGTVTADASTGAFSYALSSADILTLGQGAGKTVTATTTGGSATSLLFSIDTIAPSTPTITSVGGSDSIVSSVAGDNLIVGTAEPGATVTIKAGLTVLGSVPAGVVGAGMIIPIGSFSYALSASDLATLGQGSGKTVTASATDAAGNVGPSTTSSAFTINTATSPLTGGIAVTFAGALPSNGGEMFQIRSFSKDSTGHVTVDVYAHLTSSMDSYDLSLDLGAASNIAFTSSLDASWTVLSNKIGSAFSISAYSLTPKSAGDLKMGALAFDAGTNSSIHLAVGSGSDVAFNGTAVNASTYAIDLTGAAIAQSLNGTAGNDLIAAIGFTSTVTINAGGGSDMILVEASNATGTGGAGADTYQIGKANTHLVITDFDKTADRIDFSNLTGVTSTTIQAMIAAAVESGTGTQLKTVLYLDPLDGVAGNDTGSVELSGLHKTDLSTSLFVTGNDHSLLNQLEGMASAPPTITSPGTATAAENIPITTPIYKVIATDPNPSATLIYSIAGGADASLFHMNSNGEVFFNASPDYEKAIDTGRNNVYDIIVQASDGSLSATQAVTITITDMAEGVRGIDYFWKADANGKHALLSGVTDTLTGGTQPAEGANAPIQFKNITWDAAGHATADVYAHIAAATDAMDIHIGIGSGAGATFTSSLTSDWTLLGNATGNEYVIGGYSLTPLAVGDVKVGTLTFDTGSAAQMHLSVNAGTTVGGVNATPYGYNIAHSTTGADGSYAITPLDAGSYTEAATRSTSDIGNAITSADALAALKIAVGIDPNPIVNGAQLAVSPFQIMSADVNSDGRVTSADALAILKIAVHMNTALTPQWMFVEETRDLSGLSRSSASWDHNIAVTMGTSDTTENLVGVLSGDVNGSWTPPTGTQYVETTDPTHFTALNNTLHIPLSEWGVL